MKKRLSVGEPCKIWPPLREMQMTNIYMTNLII